MLGGIPTPLKNMSSSVGMMTFITEWEVIQCHGSSHHQPDLTSCSSSNPLVFVIHPVVENQQMCRCIILVPNRVPQVTSTW